MVEPMARRETARSNVLQFPKRTGFSDAEKLQLAMAEMDLARAHYEAAGANSWIQKLHGANPAQGPLRDERDRLLFVMQEAALRLAHTPVTQKRQIAFKRRTIGRVWLGGEGPFYDSLREGLEADERRFAAD